MSSELEREPIVSAGSYPIRGGDFERGGSASQGLKETLKRIGVEPQIIRRAIIAAYEAEMNVVIYAEQGAMRFSLDATQLDVDIEDSGPGIADIDQAMQEGFSTAPAAARELGFGAGMGLPNIRKNADRMEIRTNVGRGTKLRFTIYLKALTAGETAPNSVAVVGEQCRSCLRCVRACPTKALRHHGGGPKVLPHLCIDCAACITACDAGVIGVQGLRRVMKDDEAAVLIGPPAFAAQFGPSVNAEALAATVKALGFGELRLTQKWERALRAAVVKFSREEAKSRPVISSVCPAIANLIETRFHALLPHLAPFLSPIEAAQEEAKGRRAVFIVSCPCQQTVLKQRDRAVETAQPGAAVEAVRRRIAGKPAAAGGARRSEDESVGGASILQVTGARHVMAALESIENGLLDDVDVVELFACAGGCFGSPLFAEEADVARHRWQQIASAFDGPANAIRRKAPFALRAGLRLDPDISKAIQKLARIDALARDLPGRDCAMCGAPTCLALAEDVVMGRAVIESCVHRHLKEKHP